MKSVHRTLDWLFRRLQLVLFVCSLLINNEAVTSSSLFEHRGIEITHSIDRDAVLTCRVKDLGKRRVIWSKLSDPYPISVGSTKFTPSNKYRVDVKDDTYTLTIKNVNLGDAGEYQCRVSGQVFLADVITINIQGGDGNTYLLTTETEILADIGSTALLPCHVENLHDKLVLWKDEKNEVLTLRKKIYSGDRRLSVVHRTRPQWSLQIKKVTQTDYGLYTCVINSEPVLTRTVLLKNPAPAQTAPALIEDGTFRKRVTVSPRDTVTIACNFKANPPANVTWYKREKVRGESVKTPVGTGNVYTIMSISPEQGGNYICMGRNGVSPTGRGKTRIIVLVPTTLVPTTTTRFVPTAPSAPQLYHEEERVGQRRGRNGVLHCIAVGDPRPTVKWKRHGYEISPDYKNKIEESPEGRFTSNSKLTVRSLIARDYGQYECIAHNELGLVRIFFELYESS